MSSIDINCFIKFLVFIHLNKLKLKWIKNQKQQIWNNSQNYKLKVPIICQNKVIQNNNKILINLNKKSIIIQQINNKDQII